MATGGGGAKEERKSHCKILREEIEKGGKVKRKGCAPVVEPESEVKLPVADHHHHHPTWADTQVTVCACHDLSNLWSHFDLNRKS